MALNNVAYFVNPSNSKSVGTTQTVATNATTTVYTVGSNEAKRITNLTLTSVIIGTAGTDYVDFFIQVGSAKVYIRLNSATGIGQSNTLKMSDLGLNPSFLQVGDTIQISTTKTGSPTGAFALFVTIDDYNA